MPKTDYWDEKGLYHLGGRIWFVNPNLTIGSKPDTGIDTDMPAEVKPMSPAESCPSFDKCSAPFCPLDKQSLKGIWYPDEAICNRQNAGVKRERFIIIQRRIARKAKDRNLYFTMRDLLSIQSVRNPQGHNPDTEAWQKPSNLSNTRHLSRVAKKETGVLGIPGSPTSQIGLWDTQKGRRKEK